MHLTLQKETFVTLSFHRVSKSPCCTCPLCGAYSKESTLSLWGTVLHGIGHVDVFKYRDRAEYHLNT